MDTNTLYILLAALLAIVVVIGLLKSDIFKVKATKDGLDIAAGKNPEKDQVRIKNVSQSDIEVAQKDGHHVDMKKITGSNIKVTK